VVRKCRGVRNLCCVYTLPSLQLCLASYENLRFIHPICLIVHRKNTEYTQGTLTTEKSRIAVESKEPRRIMLDGATNNRCVGLDPRHRRVDEGSTKNEGALTVPMHILRCHI
jgi:hypothetical protein